MKMIQKPDGMMVPREQIEVVDGIIYFPCLAYQAGVGTVGEVRDTQKQFGGLPVVVEVYELELLRQQNPRDYQRKMATVKRLQAHFRVVFPDQPDKATSQVAHHPTDARHRL